MLPDQLTLADLEGYIHPDYYDHLETWNTIRELREGGPTLTKVKYKYLPKRPGEEDDLYRLRLQKFTYTPVMATAVRDFVAKLLAAPVHLSGIDQSDPFWSKFLNDMDGKKADQAEVLTKIFHSLLYYGRVYVGVDQAPQPQARSLLESPTPSPKVFVYEPFEVVHWSDEVWYLTRTFEYRNEPMTAPAVWSRWVYWGPDETAVYESPVYFDRAGNIAGGFLGNRKVSKKVGIVPKVSSFQTSSGPMLVKMELPSHLWIGGQVYLKQIEHLVVENSWLDAGSVAGSIQRVFTPAPPTANNDPRYVLTQPDYEDLKVGNPYLLIGNDYKFVESTGAAIASLTSQLETIEGQIKDLVAMGFASGTRGTVAQSGLSKQIDQALLEDNLKVYGAKGVQLYQDVLELVTRLANRPEEPLVTGLDQYSTDTLAEMLEATEGLMIAADFVPDTAFRYWFAKMVRLMVGSQKPEVLRAIESEMDDIFSGEEEDRLEL